MKLILIAILSIFSLTAFAAPQVQPTIDQCIQANKSNPDQYPGCYDAVIDQVRTLAKDKVQQAYKDDFKKAEQQNKPAPQISKPTSSAPAASQLQTPSVTTPQIPSKPAVQPQQKEPAKTGSKIRYF